MKQLLKNECSRIFRTKEFWIILVIGCGISVWHFFKNVYHIWPMNPALPTNVYTSWIGASSYAMQSYWYYMIFPLLAVMPFAGTFYDDLRSGYIKSVLLRCSRKKYFTGKGIAVFLSGGVSVTVPLVLSFILTATQMPALRPDPYTAIGPATSYFGSTLYYLHPLMYTMVYLLFDFCMGGILAVGAMLLCYRVSNKFVALLIPYALYYALYCLGGIFDTNVYSPNLFLIPGFGIEKVGSILLSIGVTVFVMIIYIWRGKHYEA